MKEELIERRRKIERRRERERERNKREESIVTLDSRDLSDEKEMECSEIKITIKEYVE